MAVETNEPIGDDEVAGFGKDVKSRLAAAEFDIKIMARHTHDGSHPNLLEV